MAERFIDAYLPDTVPGWPCVSSPRFSTGLVVVDSGDEQADRRWQHPLYSFTLPDAVRDQNIYEAVRDHWLVMGGPFRTWPFKDPLDFASVPLAESNVTPTISATDQILGTGDGFIIDFQLIKTYTVGANTYDRIIYLPRAGTTIVTVNGVDPTTFSPSMTWSVSRPGGLISFAYPPIASHVVRAGFLFDNEVRFESDDAFDGIAHEVGLGGFANIPLTGVRRC